MTFLSIIQNGYSVLEILIVLINIILPAITLNTIKTNVENSIKLLTGSIIINILAILTTSIHSYYESLDKNDVIKIGLYLSNIALASWIISKDFKESKVYIENALISMFVISIIIGDMTFEKRN